MQATPTTVQSKKLWQRRVPTILGLGFLVVGLIVGVIFMGKGAGVFAPRATPETTPRNVRLTNVTDSTFTVSFETDSPTTASVIYGTEEKKTNLTYADDRVQINLSTDKYTTHHITLRRLEPNTTYYYLIKVDDGPEFDNNGSVFRVTTARRAGTPTATKTINGSVTNETGGPATGAIVYVKTDGAGDMSTLVTNTGGWAIPLSNARTPDGSAYATLTDDSSLDISVVGTKNGQTTHATATIGNFQQAAALSFGAAVAQASASPTATATPTPPPTTAATPDTSMATIGTETTPTGSESARSSSNLNALNETNSSSTASGSTAASPSASTKPVAEVTVVDLTKTAKPTVTTDQPVITGKAAANVKVTIQVHSNEAITQEVTSDSSGNFEFDLAEASKNLEPGEHTVTYTYTDPATGKEVTKTKTFTVASRTIALASTPTPTPYGTTNPYPIGGATDSAEMEDTPTPTPKNTSTKSATAKTSTRSGKISTSSGLPVSGAVGTTLALIFGGAFFIIAGTWSFWASSQFTKRHNRN